MKRTGWLCALVCLLALTSCGGKEQTDAEIVCGGKLSATSRQETTASAQTMPAPAATTAAETEKYTFTEGKYVMKEVEFTRDGLKIWGRLYLPEGSGRFPLLVVSHGLGGTYKWETGVAEAFAARGVAAYIFDFVGGGPDCRSDGTMQDMSILTEAADLEAVLDGLLARDDVDPENVFLWGESQGGMVETIVASRRPEQIRGMIALFPGYVIGDFAKRFQENDEELKKAVAQQGVPAVGDLYIKDATSFDIYELIPKVTCPVLIFHGAGDPVVPVEYSRRAQPLFPDAELVVYDDVKEHSLGSHYPEAVMRALQLVRENSAR